MTSIVNHVLKGGNLLIESIKDYFNLILLRIIKKIMVSRDGDSSRIRW